MAIVLNSHYRKLSYRQIIGIFICLKKLKNKNIRVKPNYHKDTYLGINVWLLFINGCNCCDIGIFDF